MSRFESLKSNSYKALCLFSLFIVWTASSQAMQTDKWDNAFQIHGFLTQGYVNTTANSFFGDSKDGSFEFRELGVNSSYRFNPQLMLSAQLLSRTAGEMYDGSLNIDYAQIDFTPYSSEDSRIGAILGRFKNPFGFYNDTRDVASTRPSIFVPQVIYWDRVRNMVLSNDGGMFYADLHTDLHSFYFKLFAGKTPIDKNVESAYLITAFDPDLTQRGLTKGGRLLYEWDGGVFRLALSGATLDLEGTMAGGALEGTIDIVYWIASAQYNRGPWSLTLEYMNEPIDYKGFNHVMDAGDTTVDGYYLQGTYRFSPDWELLARYEEAHFDKNDRDGIETSIKLPPTKPYNHFTKMLTVGVLWEPTDRLMLRAEFSRVDGAIFLSDLENPDLSETERYWNMLALLVSYSF
ncbi:MAG: hypothetical protein ABFS39_18815 [Pseudomonadota bacterium]